MTKEIKVSIICKTYNHEKYIKKTINSFLMQKTNFRFEIIVHDDASTDNTSEIIRKFALENPNLIKTIFQSENQYSKGVKITPKYIDPVIEGKYTAICEGDDYWIDPYKLQKQVDYMEENPDCTFCFTNGVLHQGDKLTNKRVIPWIIENKSYYHKKNRKYNAGEIQLLGYIPTASMMYRSNLNGNWPEFYYKAQAGDNALKLFATSEGYAYLIDDVTCAYRFGGATSATTQWKKSGRSETIKRCDNFIELLDNFNAYSNYYYDKDIGLSKITWEVLKLRLEGDYIALKDEKYKNYFKLLNLKKRIMYRILIYLPFSHSLINVLSRQKA